MEPLVVTLDTARKLKAAKFPQGHNDHYFFWIGEAAGHQPFRKLVNASEARYYRNQPDYFEVHAAPTAQEIADQLPTDIGLKEIWIKKGWRGELGSPSLVVEADTMAEVLALLWLKLHEEARS